MPQQKREQFRSQVSILGPEGDPSGSCHEHGHFALWALHAIASWQLPRSAAPLRMVGPTPLPMPYCNFLKPISRFFRYQICPNLDSLLSQCGDLRFFHSEHGPMDILHFETPVRLAVLPGPLKFLSTCCCVSLLCTGALQCPLLPAHR